MSYTFMFLYMFFFFFQAEDGIRDTSVTGVQTCALPISLVRSYLKAHDLTSVDDVWFVFYGRVAQILKTQAEGLLPSGWEERSEERRVGKECRCGWWTYH